MADPICDTDIAKVDVFCETARLASVCTSTDSLVERIVRLTSRLLRVDEVVLYLADDERRELYRIESLEPVPYRFVQVPYSRNVPGSVAKTRLPLRLPGEALGTGVPPTETQVLADGSGMNRSVIPCGTLGPVLCVPVFAPPAREEHLLAVLLVARRAGRPVFSADDEALLTLFAREVGVAVDNWTWELACDKIENGKCESPSQARANASLLPGFLRGRDNGNLRSPYTPVELLRTTPPLLEPRVSTTTRTLQDMSPVGVDAYESTPWFAAPVPLDSLSQMNFSALRMTKENGALAVVSMANHIGVLSAGSVLEHAGASDALLGLAASILDAYLSVPFHNWRHGLDAAHCIYTCLLRTMGSLTDGLPRVFPLAVLLGALAHDIGHRGHTNAFENSTYSNLALLYNTSAVLEHHHVATFFRIFRGLEGLSTSSRRRIASESVALATTPFAGTASVTATVSSAVLRPTIPTHANVLNLSRVDFGHLHEIVVAGILATDMERHADIVRTLQRPANASSLSASTLAAIFLHAADFSGQISPSFDVALEWAERCNAEFHEQALLESANGLPSLPYMVGLEDQTVRAHQQVVFLDYVVAPLWKAVGIAFPELADLAASLPSNRDRFKSMSETESAPATGTGSSSGSLQGGPYEMVEKGYGHVATTCALCQLRAITEA